MAMNDLINGISTMANDQEKLAQFARALAAEAQSLSNQPGAETPHPRSARARAPAGQRQQTRPRCGAQPAVE